MTKQQRFRYEMLVRVRDYGLAHNEVFPEASPGGRAFARVAAAVAAADEHMKDQVLGKGEAGRVKAATRAAVFDSMKTIALAGRRVTGPETGRNPFKVPTRRGLKVEIATARAFIEEAETRRGAFVRLGLPSTFIDDFRAQVDALQRAVDVRVSSKTVRRQAGAGVKTALAEGLEAVRDLEVTVVVETRTDPTRFAAWQSARHIEGQSTQRPPTPAATPAAPAPAMPLPLLEAVGAEPVSPPAAPPTAPDVASDYVSDDVLRRAS
ncbi:MAG: hypothetical protein ABJC89_24350 [Acidobacteriota bacterium]